MKVPPGAWVWDDVDDDDDGDDAAAADDDKRCIDILAFPLPHLIVFVVMLSRNGGQQIAHTSELGQKV